jgi:regulator of sigma E protease
VELTFFKILIGLFALGIVVFVHELGHFLAARLTGIHVEAFSIGWGKPFFKKKIGEVEYRLGVFPVGGYCKMAGEGDYEKAWQQNQSSEPLEKGTYFAAQPWQRIITAGAGPLFNIIFAVLVFTLIWWVGFEYETMDNRISLAEDASIERDYPAKRAGLHTGDRIVQIDGAAVENFRDLQRMVVISAEKSLHFVVERDGEILEFDIVPELQKENAAGIIGVRPFSSDLIRYHTPDYSLAGAFWKGAEETLVMLVSTIRGFRLLFSGIDLTKSVSGPARITWMAGEIATEGFGQGVGDGLRLLANFLALISIALGVTNLLPLPILDGGAIVLFLVEMIRRRRLSPRVFACVQTAGIIIIAGLMILALTGDVLFFMNK